MTYSVYLVKAKVVASCRGTYFWITNNKSSKLNILNHQIDVNKETIRNKY
jgi:hypothetical protein